MSRLSSRPSCVIILRDHPAVRLSFLGGNTEEIVGALLSQRIDLGLIEGPNHRRDLKAQRFFEDEIIAVAARNHPVSQVRTLAPTRLLSQSLLLREPGSGTREYVEQALRRVGLKPERLPVMAEVPSSEAIKGIVQSGWGVSFLSRLCVREELKSGALREIKIRGVSIRRHFLALHHQGPPPGGPAGAFLQAILRS